MKHLFALSIVALAGTTGCPADHNPPKLWLAGDPNNELVTFLADSQPLPY